MNRKERKKEKAKLEYRPLSLGYFTRLMIFLLLPSDFGMLADIATATTSNTGIRIRICILLIMTRHGAKPIRKNRTPLYQLPIVQHVSVLHRAFDFLLSARNDLRVVCGDGLVEAGLALANTMDRVNQVGDVADTVI